MRTIALAVFPVALLVACAADPADDALGRSRLTLSADTMMGVHFAGDGDADARDLDAMMAGRRGFTTELVYAENPDWIIDQAAYLRRLRDRGLTIVLRIDWARGQNIPPPGREEELVRYVRDVVVPNVRDSVSIFVIGNEANLDLECAHSGGRCEPEHYAQVYRRVRDAVRAAYPGEPLAILVGGVSPGSVAGPRYMDGNEYLRRVLRATGSVDGLAIHSYGGGDLESSLRGFTAGVTEQLAVARETGHGGVPVFITEMNRETTGGADDERVTAEFLGRAYEWLAAHNRSGTQDIVAACWFVYADSPGWRTYSLRAHPAAWSAFRAVASAAPPPGELGAPSTPGPSPSCDPPHTVLVGDRCVPSCGRAGGDTCGGAGSGVCDGHALLESSDCAVCCARSGAPPPPPPPPPPGGDCGCGVGIDNVCFLPAGSCSATTAGGYCDPNGDGNFEDGDWVRGYYEHRDRCSVAPPPPPPSGCPCRAGLDNFCAYPPRTEGCDMTWPGDYCDPDGDGSYADGDWSRGWTEVAERC